ncbi:hypothetical protein [Rheinheimera maricola]|uniref:Uncharacterized protein n=1 Tax=Rheinheimera maricola TaxID=2793282 RepID=A0ABS7XEJ0_9GAMM|nr:hypothetical protein [Rheinheimera maricola]MBZ9613470.1 hypothetical protein [Rheinheimera maricola]
MSLKEHKVRKVYPKFTCACGPKSAVLFILVHTAIIMLLFQYGLIYFPDEYVEIGLKRFSDIDKLIFAGLASLLGYVLLELLLTVFFIKKISKPLVLTNDYLIIPEWAIRNSAVGRTKQRLRIAVDDISDIKTRFSDASKLPLLRHVMPAPMLLTLAMGDSSVTLDLKHVGFFAPIHGWLKNISVPVDVSASNKEPHLKRGNFNSVTLACVSLSLMMAFFMPLLLWSFSP